MIDINAIIKPENIIPDDKNKKRRSTFEEKKALIGKLNLFNDLFFSVVMKDKGAAEYVLNMCLGRNDLKIIKYDIQFSIRNLAGRSVTLDFVAEDVKGRIYNIEIQNSSDEDYFGPKRSRLHQSLLDWSFSQKGKSFNELPDLYIIFITHFNPLKIYNRNKIVYFTKTVIDGDLPWDCGVYQIYLNASAKDGSKLSDMLQYFKTADPNDSRFGPLSQAVANCKNSEKEIDYMYDAFEEFAKGREEIARSEGIAIGKAEGINIGKAEGINIGKAEGATENAIKVVRALLSRGFKLEEAFMIADIDAGTYNSYNAVMDTEKNPM